MVPAWQNTDRPSEPRAQIARRAQLSARDEPSSQPSRRNLALRSSEGPSWRRDARMWRTRTIHRACAVSIVRGNLQVATLVRSRYQGHQAPYDQAQPPTLTRLTGQLGQRWTRRTQLG
ncbi:hypothetical protein HPB47_001872 [Ixodes persulcatus]|uniref:Uncharacterized protein n=1 Tax=Ixodes persulcatus TaxID=34615 RepID=A0AC60PMT5_IXOPE|nr:hypothetical protein HPB47_001872 [Ixodes persulcatus]